jgi:D-alanyl-D-alanine-carboxypeptidase/D-alanyl-D-alanine-endopeptidase
MQASGQQKFPIFAESQTKFFLKVVDAQVSFVPAATGKPAHLILHQGGMDQRATKE